MTERGDWYAQSSSRLPPRDYWLFDPEKDERYEMPVDDNGLVDTKEVIRLIKLAIDPAYAWNRLDEINVHHIYFERNRYPNLPDQAVNPEVFRL